MLRERLMIDVFSLIGSTIALVQEFVIENKRWAAPAAFALALVKSLPLVPLFVPAISVLLAIGALIGNAGLDFTPVWIAIALGAALGDWVAFTMGQHFGPVLHASAFAARHSELPERSENFTRRWGGSAIVIRRFVGPLRATVPFAAGMGAMPATSFHVANWSSAFVWAGVLLAPRAWLLSS